MAFLLIFFSPGFSFFFLDDFARPSASEFSTCKYYIPAHLYAYILFFSLHLSTFTHTFIPRGEFGLRREK